MQILRVHLKRTESETVQGGTAICVWEPLLYNYAQMTALLIWLMFSKHLHM